MPIVTVVTLITTFKDSLLKLGADVKKEIEFFIDNGLLDYVESIRSKFAHTKTFLYRNETVAFYDVFFPVSLRLGDSPKVKKLTSCDDLFESSHFVTIIGTAGSGKTMLMKHFFLTSIDKLYKIPIYVELRTLNDYDKSFADFMYEVIFNNKLSPDQRILERLLDSGQFILLLDGYDEIFSTKKDKITNDIDKFIDRYSKNNFIISSRPGSGIESLPRFNNYFVQELGNDEVFSFIDLVLKENDDKESSTKIKNVITQSFNTDYSSFLRSPLLLSMFILTFHSYPELPKKKSKFYWNVFDTLATKHDTFTKKGGYQHERKTKLQNEDFEIILQWFSFISLFQGKLNFDAEYLTRTLNGIKGNLKYEFSTSDLIEDLTLAISIIIIDGIEYKFPHKSLQEYFCATLIKGLSGDAKEKIYKEKFTSYIESSTGGFDNLWNLCYELDRVSFLRNFVIFNLIRFRNNVYHENSLEQLRLFYNYIKISEHIRFTNTKIHLIGFSFDNDLTMLFQNLLNYLKIEISITECFLVVAGSEQHSDDFTRHVQRFIMQNKGTILSKSDMDERWGYSFSAIEFWNELQEILVKLDYQNVLKSLIVQIDHKLLGLKSEIDNEEKNIDLLLSL